MKIFALLIFTIAGCTGDLIDIRQQQQGNDMTMSQSGDMDTSGADMTGMTGMDGSMPQAVKFIPDILMDINVNGCPGCHTSGQTMIVKGTPGNEDADYTAFTAQANTGASSPVLIQNLAVAAGGDAAHSVHPFADTTNATYQRWLSWINAGNPKGP